MSKKKNIRKKEKPNFLSGLRELTNIITFSSQDKNKIEQFINKYNFDESIFKRLISYVYFYPHLIHYWNTYFNDFFLWNKTFSSKIKRKENTIKLLMSFGFTLIKNNCNNKKNYMFIKSELLRDKNRYVIQKLLREYFETINNKKYNEKEINFFYDLFLNGVITDIDLMKIDQLLHDGKSTIDIQTFEIPESNNQTETKNIVEINTSFDFTKREFTKEISDFIHNVKKYKLSRPECQKCGLFNSQMVVLDTNLEKIEPVDIAFIGLNPGTSEKEIGLPFVGVSGKKLREKLYLLPNNIKWVIFNVVLCYTKSEKDIPPDAYQNCLDNFKNLCKEFDPKYYVFLGGSAAKYIGINSGITKKSGNIINGKFIPIIHPSSLRSQKMIDIWDRSFETVYNLFKNNNTNQIIQNNSQINKFNIPQNQIITEIDENLTFFDVKDIGNNKIIKIFIDQNGQKKYLFEDYKIEFHLKNTDFKNCQMISNQVDYKISIDGSRKFFISKLLHDQLKNIINV